MIVKRKISHGTSTPSRVKVPHIGPRPRSKSGGKRIKIIIKKPKRK